MRRKINMFAQFLINIFLTVLVPRAQSSRNVDSAKALKIIFGKNAQRSSVDDFFKSEKFSV